MSGNLDCVVVGAGVVGLACAAHLAREGRDVVVLERHNLPGSETSSRNSEVIHAGIYYPEGSLKARLCVEGKARLYEYCENHAVPFRNCGKIIVAADETQIGALETYQRQAEVNGVGRLEWLDAAQVRAMEPEVKAAAGVYSPTTGIIDSHAYMLSLQGELEAHGGMIAFGTAVESLALKDHRILLRAAGEELGVATLVICAGLSAPDLTRQLLPDTPRAYFARGHYYSYAGRPPFRRLVYPIAEPGGLGVHVTLDLAGQVKFGPDVEWCENVDYHFDDSRRAGFEKAIRRYFPGLDAHRLQPDYVGVRPKISGPGQTAADFRIDGPMVHGVPGLVSLLGIESPGLTASLAIARHVSALLEQPA
ncbi:MAG: NAD(P)/FAD-dependent oxidoreductase [Pseudomonadales bacterium]